MSQNPQEVLIDDEFNGFDLKFTDKRYEISQNRLQSCAANLIYEFVIDLN
jgi:hypothetical protein